MGVADEKRVLTSQYKYGHTIFKIGVIFVTKFILIFVLPISFVCFGRKQKLRLNCVASIYPVCNGETCGLACFMWVKLNVFVFVFSVVLYLY